MFITTKGAVYLVQSSIMNETLLLVGGIAGALTGLMFGVSMSYRNAKTTFETSYFPASDMSTEIANAVFVTSMCSFMGCLEGVVVGIFPLFTLPITFGSIAAVLMAKTVKKSRK